MRHANTWQALIATQLESLGSVLDTTLDTTQQHWHAVSHEVRALWSVELKPWLTAALWVNGNDHLTIDTLLSNRMSRN